MLADKLQEAWDELSLCIVPKPGPLLRGARRSIASYTIKYLTKVKQLNILVLSHLSSPISLDLFMRPSLFTVTLNLPVEIYWLQIIIELDSIIVEVSLKAPQSRLDSPSHGSGQQRLSYCKLTLLLSHYHQKL